MNKACLLGCELDVTQRRLLREGSEASLPSLPWTVKTDAPGQEVVGDPEGQWAVFA